MIIKREAFLLNSYMIENQQLNLIGRVLTDIKRGDVLLYKNKSTEACCKITNIVSYRHELNEISAGMTCKLIVEGNMYNFKEDIVLYIIN